MADTLVAHFYPNAVIRLNDVMSIQAGEAVGFDELPICTAGEYTSGNVRSGESPAGNGDGSGETRKGCSQFECWADVDAEFENEFELRGRVCCGYPSSIPRPRGRCQRRAGAWPTADPR